MGYRRSASVLVKRLGLPRFMCGVGDETWDDSAPESSMYDLPGSDTSILMWESVKDSKSSERRSGAICVTSCANDLWSIAFSGRRGVLGCLGCVRHSWVLCVGERWYVHHLVVCLRLG